MKRWLLVCLVLVMFTVFGSGCYWNRQVEENEVGLAMPDGVHVEQVVGPGRYTNMGYYAEMKVLDTSAKTVQWQDPDLVTSDKQPIGFNVSATFSRKRDAESIQTMWRDYNAEARFDEALQQQVLARIPRVAKGITTKYSLDEMLGIKEGTNRSDIQNAFFTALDKELSEINVRLLDVGINNIAPSQQYLNALEAKANAQVNVEVAREQTKLKEEQLKQEQAETQIQLELASRQRQVEEETAKVFTGNSRWYELRRLELLGKVLNDKDKIYFVPQGTDITLFLSGQSVPPTLLTDDNQE